MNDSNLSNWSLIFFDHAPADEPLRDSLCILGNGYFLSKGVCWKSQLSGASSPASYLIRKNSPLQALSISTDLNHSLTQIPDWESINFRIDDGNWFNLNDVKIGSYQQELNLRNGVLYREIDFVDPQNRHSVLIERRFIHKSKKNFGCISWSIKSIDWSGRIEICSNAGYSSSQSGSNCFTISDCSIVDETSSVILSKNSETNDQLSIVTLHPNSLDQQVDMGVEQQQSNKGIQQNFSCDIQQEQQIKIEKIVYIKHGRDISMSDLNSEAIEFVDHCPTFNNLYASHLEAYHFSWDQIHLDIQSQEASQSTSPLLLARLQLFRLLQMGELIHDDHLGLKKTMLSIIR
ncbi:MAG: hypothetical protein AAGG81_03955 [Chlamydiota bacterium]